MRPCTRRAATLLKTFRGAVEQSAAKHNVFRGVAEQSAAKHRVFDRPVTPEQPIRASSASEGGFVDRCNVFERCFLGFVDRCGGAIYQGWEMKGNEI